MSRIDSFYTQEQIESASVKCKKQPEPDIKKKWQRTQKELN